jgi:predicted Zn-dependent protease
VRPPQEVVERALSLSRSDGCAVVVEERATANLRWANNTLTTNGSSRYRFVTVVSVKAKANASGTVAGVFTRPVTDDDSLSRLVEAADAAASSGEPSEDAAPLVEGEAGSGWEDPPGEASADVLVDLVPSLGEALGKARAEGRLLFGYAEHTNSTTYLGSSTGLRLRHHQPAGHIEVNAKSHGFERSAWAGVASEDFASVDLASLGDQLAQRLSWAERKISLPPGRYDTILPPTAVADLMVYLYWSSAAREANDGRSVWSRPGGGTRVGEKVTDQPITLRSDPSEPGLRCSPYVIALQSSSELSVFDNGLPVGPTSWVDSGTLNALVQTRYTSQLTGLPLTPYVDNLVLEGPGGGRSLEEMVAGEERALLLTCLWYIREVDPQTLLLTGLTRDGVYLVEHGEVVGAVNNFRFNESPVDLLGRVTEIGATERAMPREWGGYFNRVTAAPLRVSGFNMSSVSPAT